MAEGAHAFTVARHYVDVGRPRDALQALDGAGSELENPHFWRLRAVAHYQLDEYDKASAAAREGLVREPHDVGLLSILSAAEGQAGRLGEAERAILAALELAPDDPDLLCDYARVVARAGQLDKADRLVDQAAAFEPDNPEIDRVRSLLAYLRGKDRQAAAHAERALELDPDDPRAHALRGNALIQRGDARGARRSFEAVARDDPSDHQVAGAARGARAVMHPLLWPVYPIYRLGPIGSWVAAVAIIFGLRGLGQDAAAGVASLVWIFVVVYSWTVAPMVQKRLSS